MFRGLFCPLIWFLGEFQTFPQAIILSYDITHLFVYRHLSVQFTLLRYVIFKQTNNESFLPPYYILYCFLIKHRSIFLIRIMFRRIWCGRNPVYMIKKPIRVKWNRNPYLSGIILPLICNFTEVGYFSSETESFVNHYFYITWIFMFTVHNSAQFGIVRSRGQGSGTVRQSHRW